MTYCGIAENLVSDAIFVVAVMVLGWLFYAATRRRSLLRFFWINESRRLTIYLSNHRVTPGGSLGTDGQPRSFQGTAVSFAEMLAASRFRDSFNYLLPSLAEKPGLLSRLLISDVRVQLHPSPLEEGLIEHITTIITLGGPAHNLASRYAQENSQVKIEQVAKNDTEPESQVEQNSATLIPTADSSCVAPSAVTMLDASDSSGTYRTELPDVKERKNRPTRAAIVLKEVLSTTDPNTGFVERLVDHESNQCIFYLAGISPLATLGSVSYLLSERKSLNKKYGSDTDFAVILRFDSSDYRRWSVVCEREGKSSKVQ